MSIPNYEYIFPEKRGFYAMEVTEPEFNIMESNDWFDKLFVDFSPLRSPRLFAEMKFALGIRGDEFFSSYNFEKIIFSGHRGCGKSIELQRFAKEIHQSDQYFAIYIDLEQEVHLSRFQPEDLIIVLISVLLRKLNKENIYIKGEEFESIASEWLSEKEVSQELKDAYGWETEGSVKAGWSFWQFFGIEGKMRGVYSQENQTTQTIRKKVKSNQRQLAEKLNIALLEVRDALRYHDRGQDLVIILDGLEKARPEVYETLFVEDIAMIESLDLHLISCVPIKTFYDIQHRPALDIYKLFYLPMVRVSPQNRRVFESLLTKRIAPELFQEGIIDRFVDKSGGCPRQLLKIVNLSLQKSLGHAIDQSIADETLNEMGNERFRALTAQHKALLRAGQYDDADKELLELLFSLNLLEYNGTHPDRKINPLIKDFFN